MRRPFLGAVLVTIALLVGACSGASAPTSAQDLTGIDQDAASGDETSSDEGEPALVDSEDLDGTSWTLIFGGGPEGEIVLVDGWPITLTFDGNSFGGTAACNGYGASFQLDGSSFQVSELGSEDAGCEPAVQEAEQGYFGALPDIDGINLVGDELALSGPASELIFWRNAPLAINDVTSTLWLLEALLQDGVPTPVAGDPATLRVDPGGALDATTGCRTLTGTYIVVGNEILLTNFGTDGNTICPTSLRDQDTSVVTVLGDGFVPQIDGDELTLTSSGNEGLRYRATTEDEVASLDVVAAPSDAEMLAGVEWIFTGGSNPDGEIPDPRSLGDQSITLVFGDGSFSGAVNCNTYGGQAEVNNGRWTFSTPEGTEEGCGAELDAIAAAYLQALPLVSEFGIDSGGNRLSTNDGEGIELSFERS